ncbi:hypothetical protein B0H13DRAFT_1895778 [Mycena leptocephala]|nr:hypothetical protein B0H13DRAFT_1895778 [Mycena leptocephala]
MILMPVAVLLTLLWLISFPSLLLPVSMILLKDPTTSWSHPKRRRLNWFHRKPPPRYDPYGRVTSLLPLFLIQLAGSVPHWILGPLNTGASGLSSGYAKELMSEPKFLFNTSSQGGYLFKHIKFLGGKAYMQYGEGDVTRIMIFFSIETLLARK